MGTIWIKEFQGGLDTRRMSEATAGGVLVRASDGHITRGGEFEKRFSFVPEFTLPAGTHGLFYDKFGLVVFGSIAPPSLPVGVSYQRIQHPNGNVALSRVLSAELFRGRIYVVGEFSDGSIHHFYDGARVQDWFDGRARASFTVVSGASTPAVAAQGSFEITGGTNGTGNEIDAITIDGVALLSAAVEHTGDNASTAQDVADAINSDVSVPNYTATADGQKVVITAADTGPAINNTAIVVTVGGDVTVGTPTNMTGGANATVSTIDDIKVNGVSIIGAPITWQGGVTSTAAEIASAINSFTSVPDYDATSEGARVNIIVDTADAGAGPNGYPVEFTLANGMELNPDTGLSLSGGVDSDDAYQPGTFVKTVGSKMYSVAGPLMHFSGIQQPTQWTTNAVGAGFVDMSSEVSGSEQLVALDRYQDFIAVFAERVVQIWYVDPDPALNRFNQTLNNTGTASAGSVTQFGDNDLFYLDESGLRSLHARDSSNVAATTDIGVPVDDLVTAQLRDLTELDRDRVKGLIDPQTGRFWLIMRDRIFVFSFFQGAQISAWSTYNTVDANGQQFDVEAATVFRRRVYLRSGNTIYCYGGIETGRQTDDTVAEAWLPYMDANDPTRTKSWTGIDAAVRGEWDVAMAAQPTDENAEDASLVVFETTYNQGRIPLQHASSHISLRFRSRGSGEARLGAVVIHYIGYEDED